MHILKICFLHVSHTKGERPKWWWWVEGEVGATPLTPNGCPSSPGGPLPPLPPRARGHPERLVWIRGAQAAHGGWPGPGHRGRDLRVPWHGCGLGIPRRVPHPRPSVHHPPAGYMYISVCLYTHHTGIHTHRYIAHIHKFMHTHTYINRYINTFTHAHIIFYIH